MEPLLIALLSGSGTAIAGLGWKALRSWRFGKIEDEQLATKNAKIAVEAVGGVLDDLRKERADQRRHINQLESALRHATERINDLEAQIVELTRKLNNIS